MRKWMNWLGLLVASVSWMAVPAGSRTAVVPERADSVLILKKDHVLELLAGGKVIRRYKVALGSGGLAAKERAGDGRTPEGHYVIDSRNEHSAYHKALHISYPNEDDRRRAAKLGVSPGGEIMIHGSCASIGCMAVQDERVEELWTMASAFQVGERRVHVHVYPARDIAALLRDPERAAHHRFWENLKEGLDRFEKDHRLFETWVDWHARYFYR